MHEGGHAILEAPKKQHKQDSGHHDHDHGHDHSHGHPHAHPHPHAQAKDPIACQSCDKPTKTSTGSAVWMKVVAGVVVTVLVVLFIIWRFR